MYEQLKASLLSYSRRLRLSALRMLCSQTDGVGAGTGEILKRCLMGEEASIDVQGVRERVLHITRINQMLRNDDEIGADVAARWLIGVLSYSYYCWASRLTLDDNKPNSRSICDRSGNPPAKP